jgi:hypothetical protein
MAFIDDLLGVAGPAYLLGEEIDAARDIGRRVSEGATELATQAETGAQFQPYTVTSTLADVGTTPTGGVGVTLSPEEQARQAARFGEAERLFTRAAADPTAATEALFEQIRAVQRPEERRELQGLQQSLFTRGRGGITTGEYGTTAEEFAYNKARAEAQDKAALLAREAVQKERIQDLASAVDLMGAGYRPQQEAIDLFGAASIPSQLAQAGQLKGLELGSQLRRAGLEGLLQSEQLASELARERTRQLIPLLTGSEDPTTGDTIGGLFGEGGLFGSGGLFDRYFFGNQEDIGLESTYRPTTTNPQDIRRVLDLDDDFDITKE